MQWFLLGTLKKNLMANCSCLGTPTVVNPPTCPTGNCLIMADIVIACADSVGPCGAVGTLNVLNAIYKHTTTACEGSPTISIHSWEHSIFSNVSISGSTISFTTMGAVVVNKFGKITLKACCGEFTSYFDVFACVKDLCKCNTCTTAQQCNPCTGNCEARLINVSVGNSNSNVDVSIL